MVRIMILNYGNPFIKSEAAFETFVTQKNGDNGSNSHYCGQEKNEEALVVA